MINIKFKIRINYADDHAFINLSSKVLIRTSVDEETETAQPPVYT